MEGRVRPFNGMIGEDEERRRVNVAIQGCADTRTLAELIEVGALSQEQIYAIMGGPIDRVSALQELMDMGKDEDREEREKEAKKQFRNFATAKATGKRAPWWQR